jgi:hypothetical protein
MSRQVEIPCPECKGEMTMVVWRESFGADADGNRGQARDEADVLSSCLKGCELTDEQYGRACAEAVDKRYAEEADFYAEPEEVEGVSA